MTEFAEFLESGGDEDFRELVRSIAKLCDGLPDFADVFASFQVEFFREI